MNKASIGWAFAFSLAACGTVLAENSAEGLNALQGEWHVIELAGYGATVPESALKQYKFDVRGDRLTYSGLVSNRPFQAEMLIAVDERSRPRTIDVKLLNGAFRNRVCHGIYNLEDDVLRVCLPERPTEKRPEQFEPKNGSSRMLFKLRRCSDVSQPAR